MKFKSNKRWIKKLIKPVVPSHIVFRKYVRTFSMIEYGKPAESPGTWKSTLALDFDPALNYISLSNQPYGEWFCFKNWIFI